MEQFTVRVPKDLMVQVREQAKKENRSINYILLDLIMKGAKNGKN